MTHEEGKQSACPGYLDVKGLCGKIAEGVCCKSCLIKRDDMRMKGEILIEISQLNPKWYIKFTAEHYGKPEFICTGCEERYGVDQSSADGDTPMMLSCVGCGSCPLADVQWGVRTSARFAAYKEWSAFANSKCIALEQ